MARVTWRVTVVDDHAQVRRVVRLWLDLDDRTAFAGEAADGIAAVDLIKRERPDAVLLDIELPGRSGLEVLRLLRDDGLDTVIVLYSGDETLRDEGMKLGADAFHTKNDPVADVIDTIAACCASR